MKLALAAAVSCIALLAASSQADAAGCLKGAAVGGVAGHVAGHHGVLGAVAGCAVGHHEAGKAARQQQQAQPATTQN